MSNEDNRVWVEARRKFDGHPASPRGAGAKSGQLEIPGGILVELPGICDWPTGLPHNFDQFRRRFDVSYERALLWNSFYVDDKQGPGWGALDDPVSWVSKTNAYIRVLQELLWTTYATVNSVGVPRDSAPRCGLRLGVKRRDTTLVRKDCSSCSEQARACVDVTLDTAVFLSKTLEVNPNHRQAFPASPSNFRGWSAIGDEEFEQKYKIVTGFPVIPENRKLLPLDAYRVFYEDDRAQMAFSIRPEASSGGKWQLTAVNGVRVPCDRAPACRDSSCNGTPQAVLRCAQVRMPQVDPESQDAYLRFLEDAVGPLFVRRESAALELATDLGADAALAQFNSGTRTSYSIGVCLATPTADLHSRKSRSIDGAFAFLNFILSLPNSLSEQLQELDLELSRAIWQQIGHLQGPLLQEMLEAREALLAKTVAQLNEKSRELEKSEQMLKLVQEPLNQVVKSFANANSSIQMLNAILNDPCRAIYACRGEIAELFDENTVIINPNDGPLTIRHEPIGYKENRRNEAKSKVQLGETPQQHAARVELWAEAAAKRDLQWLLAHFLCRVRGKHCESGPAPVALYQEVIYYEDEFKSRDKALSILAASVRSILRVAEWKELMEADTERLVEMADNVKTVLFTTFKPDKATEEIPLLCLLGVIPDAQFDSIINVRSGWTLIRCNPFPVHAHLIEFIAAFVSQATPRGTGIDFKLKTKKLGSEAIESNGVNMKWRAMRRLAIVQSKDCPRHFIREDEMPLVLETLNSIIAGKTREAWKHDDLNIGNFLSPFVDIMKRGIQYYIQDASSATCSKISLSWCTNRSPAEVSSEGRRRDDTWMRLVLTKRVIRVITVGDFWTNIDEAQA